MRVLNRSFLSVITMVFLVSAFVNWLKADIPYWPLLLHEAEYILTEMPAVILNRNALIGLLEVGTGAWLLLLNYRVGKRYKLTRTSTLILVMAFSISSLLGLLFGYGVKQTQMHQYSIFTVSILSLIPNEVGSKIVWCMLGVVAGHCKTEVGNNSLDVDTEKA